MSAAESGGTRGPTSKDEVLLAMPADPEFLRLARIAGMGLASRLSFTIDEIDDLRIAIDELLFALIGSKGRAGRVVVRYALLDGALAVTGTGDFSDGGSGPGLNDLSELILDAVADEHTIDASGPAPTFRMLKRRSAN